MNHKFISIACALSAIASHTYADTKLSRKAGDFSQEYSAPKKTADSQMKSSDADVAITRKIRDRLTDMDGLSTRAQNITIVTDGNSITLKGQVEKQEEVKKIMDVARENASGKTITNELSIHQ